MRSSFDLDFVVAVLRTTVFHFSFGVVWVIFMRALEYPWGHPTTQLAIYYTLFLLGVEGLKRISRSNKQINWKEQVVVLTGGSGGVGLCLAEALGVKGADVAVLDIRVAESHVSNVHFYRCDITERDQVKEVADKIRDEIGEPTILINNAGVVTKRGILEMAPSDIEKTFRVNILSHFWLVQEFLPAMLQRDSGHIVTVASILGLMSTAGMAAYSASKGGAVRFHDALEHELALMKSNVRTTLVCPGHINTPLFRDLPTVNAFLLPLLEPLEVGNPIINAIEKEESSVICVPCSANLVGISDMLPIRVRGWLRKTLGIDNAFGVFLRTEDTKKE